MTKQESVSEWMHSLGYTHHSLGFWDKPGFVQLSDREATFFYNAMQEARLAEQKTYMDRTRWYYPGGPDGPYIPVVQVKERIAALREKGV